MKYVGGYVGECADGEEKIETDRGANDNRGEENSNFKKRKIRKTQTGGAAVSLEEVRDNTINIMKKLEEREEWKRERRETIYTIL